MSSQEANNCKERANAATQALKAYYQQPAASQYDLDEALNALVTLTKRSQISMWNHKRSSLNSVKDLL